MVLAALEKVCELMGFEEDARGRIVLAVDEALTNIIRHAYGGAEDQPIEVELLPESSPAAGLRIRIRDHGRPVDVRRIQSRDLDDVRPGGLGVHIMTECMDHLEYQQAEGGGTVLTMFKRLSAADGGSSR